MPKNFVRKTFDHWMRKNRYRFQHPPKITKNRKNYFCFQFVGIIPQLMGNINKWGIDITMEYQGWHWDIVQSFDIVPCRNRQGQYYCDLCKNAYETGYTNEEPLLYSSRQELWEQHNFEPFLQWANENLQSSHRLCMGGAKGNSTWAFIKTLKDAEIGKWSLILPIIKHRNS